VLVKLKAIWKAILFDLNFFCPNFFNFHLTKGMGIIDQIFCFIGWQLIFLKYGINKALDFVHTAQSISKDQQKNNQVPSIIYKLEKRTQFSALL
jgi:hypothetical protein